MCESCNNLSKISIDKVVKLHRTIRVPGTWIKFRQGISWGLREATHKSVDLDDKKILPPDLGLFDLLLVRSDFLPYPFLTSQIATLGLLLRSCRNRSSTKEVLSWCVLFPFLLKSEIHIRIMQSMYQCEAMRMSFEATSYRSSAVKISVGGVNALTGLPQNESAKGKQDYLQIASKDRQL